MSLFSVLNVANRGLTASQMGLDITGQNISNADTEGYSRKRLTQQAEYRTDGSYGQVGMGVDIVNIRRIRDTTIDQQIQRQNHQFGYYDSKDKAIEAVENILNEPSDTGIISYIDKFFDSWGNLTNNPDDQAARTMVQTAGKTLADVFHNTSHELEKLKSGQNDNIRSTVKEINRIAKEIFNLNKEIAGVELAGQNANDSRDRRDLLMKDLSELTDYETIEGPDGQLTITVGGNIFISPVSLNEMELYANQNTQSTNGYVQYGVKIKGLNKEIVIHGGRLKGLMDARDVLIPSYEDKINELATSMTTTINELHKTGYNLNGYTGFDFFDASATDASTFNVSSAVASDINNIAAAKGGTQTTANTNVVPAGDLNFGNPPIQLTKTLGRPWQPTDPSEEQARDIIGDSVTLRISSTGTILKEGIDYSVNYINGTVQMLHNGYDNTQLDIDFGYTVGGFPGPGNNENAVKIAALRDELTMTPAHDGTPTATFTDFYSGLIGDVGLDRNSASSNKETREYLIKQYEDSQESIAGVSIDEEMSNLIKFQHTYQASAKIVSTTQKMLDILMNI